MNKPRYTLEVQNNIDYVFVGVHDRDRGNWAFRVEVFEPDLWDKLMRRSWDDKVARAVKKAVLLIQTFEKRQNTVSSLVTKFSFDVGKDQ